MGRSQQKLAVWIAIAALVSLGSCSDVPLTVPSEIYIVDQDSGSALGWTLTLRETVEFPLRALQARQPGCVYVEYSIDPSGKPIDIKTLSQWPIFSAYGFESALKDSLSQWRYKPTEGNTEREPAIKKLLFSYELPGIPPFSPELGNFCTSQVKTQQSG